jgi:peptide/nickel transport system substrate-binding protein
MRRRQVMTLGTVALATPLLARGATAQANTRLVRFVPAADLTVLDPLLTTTYITRNHGYMVFDQLYGLDDALRPQPQMAEGHSVEDDGRRVTIRLREGLRFHDGEPVRARDVVASLRRWAVRDQFGQTIMAITDELSAPDDHTVVFRLRRRFPLLFDALAKTSPPVFFVMPERIARTEPTAAIREIVGSGPFRYLPGERVAGSLNVYARFEGYVPRPSGTPSGTAGPKVVNLDRVEWRTIPDPATAAAAIQAGEVDVWEYPPTDLVPLLRRSRDIAVVNPDPFGFMAVMRFNHLNPPFSDPAVRRMVLPAIAQEDFMRAVAGTDPAMWRAGVGFFPPGTPLASDAGLSALTGPRDVARARAELSGALGNRRVVMIGPADYPQVQAITEVGADLFRRLGANLDYAPSDWGGVVARRARQEPSSQGGWDVVHTFLSGLDLLNPGVNFLLRAHGRAAFPGWPSSPRLEALREEWLVEDDADRQRMLARAIQEQAFQDLPYVPLGQFFQPTAWRRSISGVMAGPTMFWNIRKG